MCSLQFIKTLRQAGFKDSDLEGTAEEIESLLLSSYESRLRGSWRFPRNSVYKRELQQIAAKAKSLHTKLERLSDRSRLSILDARIPVAGTESDPLVLKKSVKELHMRATIAAIKAPKDSRGPPVRDAIFRDLLLQIGILWRRSVPTGKGIVISKSEYRGPLLRFTRQILRDANLRGRSDNALGRQIYLIRNLIDAKAKDKEVPHQ
jgi:hypothetical protein